MTTAALQVVSLADEESVSLALSLYAACVLQAQGAAAAPYSHEDDHD